MNKDMRSVAFLVALHTRVSAQVPPPSDSCAWMLLLRAVDEMQGAKDPSVFEAKALALLVLVRYGWRDVFRESLRDDGTFKSEEEAGRFQFCHLIPRVPELRLLDQG